MSNLLEKASILLTPTAYDDGKILSVKPEPSLGSELITNGDFATDTDWTKGTGWTIGGGVATANNVPNLQRLQQGLGTSIIGSKYKYSINISNVSGFYSVYIFGVYVLATSNTEGIIEGEFTATSTNGAFWVAGASASGLISATIDNVSVKEAIDGDFDFTRNSSATRVNSQGLIEDVQILSGNLVSNGDFSQEGSEQVTNGDFATDTDWINSDINGFSVSGGKLNLSNVAYAKNTSQFNVTTVGKTYKVTFEISDYVKGSVRIYLGGSVTPIQSSNGVFTSYVTVSANTTVGIQTLDGGGTTLSIDNVSVKEVGQDWTFSNVAGAFGWRIANKRAICDAEGVNNGRNLNSSTTLVNGKTYKLTLDILQSVDGMNIIIGSTILPSELPTGTNLAYEYYIYASQHSGGLFSIYGQTSDLQEITNISLIEITDDTNLPRINYEGFSYQDSLGSEEISNGSFDTDTKWTTNTGWSISGGSANCDGTQSSNATLVQQNGIKGAIIDFVVGKTYKVNFDIVVTSGWVANIEVASGYDSNTITTSGNHTTYITAVSTNDRFTITANPDFIGSIDNVSVKEVLGQEPIPDSGCGSWLFEPQRTNLVTYSEDFSQSYWDKSQISVVDDFTISLDGTQNASKITINGNTPFLGNTNISLTTGNVYTISCFVKKGTNRWVRLSSVSSTSLGAWFDLDNNVVGTVNSTSASIENYGNGWYRISNTITAISGTNQAFIGLSDADSGTNSTQVGNTVFAWGFQVEEEYATSYIPTNGSTVTRLKDAAFGSGSSDLINSTEGVLYADIAALSENYTSRRFITLNDATASNGVVLRYEASGVIVARYQIGGIAQCSIAFAATITNYHKIAFKYSLNDFALWVDGVEVGVDSSGSVLSENVLNNIDFNSGNGTFPFYGETKCLAVFKEALTDDELECLTSDETSFSSFNALALANNYTII